MNGIPTYRFEKAPPMKDGLMRHIPSEQLAEIELPVVYPFIAGTHHIPIDQVERLQPGCPGKDPKNLRIVKLIVATQEQDPFTMCRFDTLVHGIVNTFIRFGYDAYPRVAPGIVAGDVQGPVPRYTIHDQDLPIAELLDKHAVQSFRQRSLRL